MTPTLDVRETLTELATERATRDMEQASELAERLAWLVLSEENGTLPALDNDLTRQTWRAEVRRWWDTAHEVIQHLDDDDDTPERLLADAERTAQGYRTARLCGPSPLAAAAD